MVTGGSKGIGLGVGRRLAGSGYEVVLCSRGEAALTQVVSQINSAGPGSAVGVVADLGTAAGVQVAVTRSLEILGHVDVLVNVAGAAPPGTILDLTDEQWSLALDLKLMGYVRLTRALLPGMLGRRHGRIVNIAGNAGKQPDGWLLSSGVVNAAVLAMTKAVGNAVAADGVTVNAVCPGPVDTDRWTGMVNAFAQRNGLDGAEAEQRLVSGIPSGRISTVEDVVHAVSYLVSEGAGHVTGQALLVDGGQTRGL